MLILVLTVWPSKGGGEKRGYTRGTGGREMKRERRDEDGEIGREGGWCWNVEPTST